MSNDLELELNKLRSSADSLANCLGALLKRIDELEESAAKKNEEKNEHGAPLPRKMDFNDNGDVTAKMLRHIATAISSGSSNELCNIAPAQDDLEVNRREFVTIDPVSGIKKKTTVIERVLKLAQLPVVAEKHSVPTRDETVSMIFQPRIVSVSAEMLKRIKIEFFAGEAIVVKIPPEPSMLVKPGDTILEISGQPAVHKKQFNSPYVDERVTLKLVPSDIFSLPANYCKILADYRSNMDEVRSFSLEEPSTSTRQNELARATQNGYKTQESLLPYLSYDLKKGDVLQIISTDKMCMQARKVNDLSASGFVPLNIGTERIALLSAYGRRVIALLGANGVGRRTLKRMLLQKMPAHFAADVPLTSRAPKAGEIDGRDFRFVIKEEFHNLIRANQMIEWGESNGHLYGTSAESVRQIIRSGRVCLLDCTEKALKLLYTREFLPYVVVIAAPPSREELMRLATMRAQSEGRPLPTEEMLKNTWEENERLMSSPYAKYFHLVLVNRNFDITLRRLMDSFEHLRTESQWVPLDWLSP